MNAGQRQGLDRIRPPAERLARTPRGTAGEGSDGAGRAALFTHGRSHAGRGPASRLEVSCSRCGKTTAVDARTALRAALPLVLLAPWKPHPVFAVCPACGYRAWLRPRVRV
jgi:hypothetical protein